MTHGIIDIALREEQQGALKFQELYVSLTKFLTSSYAAAMGVQRIAYSTGTAPQGRGGEQYWDQGSPAYPNAWSCYKWLSASVPFYMLLQMSYTQNFGSTVPGTPGGLDGTTGIAGVGIAFAMRADGGNPWNGSINNNGGDLKGTPVWTAGASSLFVWPRSNAAGGTNQTNKEMTMGIITSNSTNGAGPTFNSHVHFVCDEDHIAIASEDAGNQNFRITYFGKYNVRTNITASCPYVCLRSSAVTNDPAIPFTVYGPTTSAFNAADGGIAHPTVPASGTRGCQTSGINEFMNLVYEPSENHNMWDEYPIHIGVSESPMFGYAGYIDWIKYISSVYNCAVSADKKRAAFGAVGHTTAKITMPWDGATIPNTSVNRTGTMF